MLGLLVGGALSLFGANKAKKDAQKATNDMNDYNNPANVRLRAEEAGFNPLLFVGPGVGQQTAPAASGQMGAAIADVGMMAAEKISGLAEQKARMQNLQLQNEKLQKELQQATLRPKSAGLYGPVATSINAGTVSSPTVSKYGVNSDLRNLLAPGEKPEREEMKDEHFLKETRLGGQSYLTPAEPDVDETLVNLMFMAPQYGRHAVRQFEDSIQRARRGETTKQERQEQKQKSARGVLDNTYLGLIDRTQGLIGWRTRPFNFFGQSQ